MGNVLGGAASGALGDSGGASHTRHHNGYVSSDFSAAASYASDASSDNSSRGDSASGSAANSLSMSSEFEEQNESDSVYSMTDSSAQQLPPMTAVSSSSSSSTKKGKQLKASQRAGSRASHSSKKGSSGPSAAGGKKRGAGGVDGDGVGGGGSGAVGRRKAGGHKGRSAEHRARGKKHGSARTVITDDERDSISVAGSSGAAAATPGAEAPAGVTDKKKKRFTPAAPSPNPGSSSRSRRRRGADPSGRGLGGDDFIVRQPGTAQQLPGSVPPALLSQANSMRKASYTGPGLDVVGVFFDARAHSVVVVFEHSVEVRLPGSGGREGATGNHDSSPAAGTRAAADVFRVDSDVPPAKYRVALPSRCTAALFVDGSDGFLGHRSVVARVPEPKRMRELEESLPWVVCACSGLDSGERPRAGGAGPAVSERKRMGRTARSVAAAEEEKSVLDDTELWSGEGSKKPRKIDRSLPVIVILRASDGMLLKAIPVRVPGLIAAPSSLEDQRDRPSGGEGGTATSKRPPASPSKAIHRRTLLNHTRQRGPIMFLEWTPDGRLIGACKAGAVIAFLLPSGTLCCDVTPIKARPTALAFDLESSTLVMGFAADNIVRIFQFPSKAAPVSTSLDTTELRLREVARLSGHTARITGIVVTSLAERPSDDERRKRGRRVVVTASRDGTVRLWPLNSPAFSAALNQPHSSADVASSADYHETVDSKPSSEIPEVCGYKFQAAVLRYDPLRRLLFVGDDNGSLAVCQIEPGSRSDGDVAAHVVQRVAAHQVPVRSLSFCSFTDTLVSWALVPFSDHTESLSREWGSGSSSRESPLARFAVVGVWPGISEISHAAAVASTTEYSQMVKRSRHRGAKKSAKGEAQEDIKFFEVGKFKRVKATRSALLGFIDHLLPQSISGVDGAASRDAKRRRAWLLRGFSAILTNLQLEIDLVVSTAQAQAQMSAQGGPATKALSTMLHRQLQELRGLCGPHFVPPPHISPIRSVLAHYKSTSRGLVRSAIMQFIRMQNTVLPVVSARSKVDSPEAQVARYRLGVPFEESSTLGVLRGMEESSGRLVAVKVLPAGVHIEVDLTHDCLVGILDVVEAPELPSVTECERAFRRACTVDYQRWAKENEANSEDSDDNGSSPSSCFVVLPMIEENLGSLIEKQGDRILMRDIAQTMFHLLRGVSFLHSHRLVVRDLRPRQILIDRNGMPQIVHLGVMRALTGEEPTEQNWSFAAPELFARTVKGSSDVWSLGVLLAYMLYSPADRASKPLFFGEDAFEVLESQLAFAGKPSSFDIERMAEECRVDEEGIALLDSVISQQDWPEHKNAGRRALAQAMPPTAPASALDLLGEMLLFPTHLRVSAVDALEHPFFQQFGLRPTEKERDQRPLTDITGTTDFDTTEATSRFPLSPTATQTGFTTASRDRRSKDDGDTSDDAGESELDESKGQSSGSRRGKGAGSASESAASEPNSSSRPDAVSRIRSSHSVVESDSGSEATSPIRFGHINQSILDTLAITT